MKRPALALIRFYQRSISPGRPLACRFAPTCSEYAYEAIDTRGLLMGGALAAWRILRCNPWSHGGVDYAEDARLFQRRRKGRPA